MLYKERWEEEHCRGPPSTASLTRALGRTPQAMCDLLWTLWGLLQHKNGNPAEVRRAGACLRRVSQSGGVRGLVMLQQLGAVPILTQMMFTEQDVMLRQATAPTSST